MKNIPTHEEAHKLLEKYVSDDYQRYHAQMVAQAMKGYAVKLGQPDPHLWYVTGLLHDVDFSLHPETHPGPSLGWFREWGYPDELIHAVEAHAYGYNGFTTLPATPLAAALMACDEMSGIFYAYRKLNPIPFKDIKASSIKKRYKDTNFAAKIERSTIDRGVAALGVELDQHILNLVQFFSGME